MAYLKNLNMRKNQFKNLSPINADKIPVTKIKTPSIFNGTPKQTIRKNASMPARITPNRTFKIMTAMSLVLSTGAIDFWLNYTLLAEVCKPLSPGRNSSTQEYNSDRSFFCFLSM